MDERDMDDECLMPKDLGAIAFDMDGVLVASEREWERVFRGVLAEYGLELTDADRADLYGCSDEHENEVLSRAAGVTIEEMAASKNDYCERHPVDYGRVVIEGGREAIAHCHEVGLKVALASSSLAVDVARMLSETGLADSFDVVVTGDHVERAKPDPAIYLRAAELLGMEPARVVAVDDSSYGYSSAHEAGMGVIQFAHDGQPPVSPDVIAVCRDFDEVSVTVDTLLAAGE